MSRDFAETMAVILAGGMGTRLSSLVADRPKVLADVQGRPFLAYLLDQLAGAGIREVVLCTGYMAESVRAMFGDSYNDLSLIYSPESRPLGTGGALRLALPLLKSDSVFVLNGDSYCEVDLKAVWGLHCSNKATLTLVLKRVADPTRFGQVRIRADGAVIGFEEKVTKDGAGLINAGIYLIRCSLLKTIRAKGAASLEQEMFPAWVGHGLYGYETRGRFTDIGTPESYEAAQHFFQRDWRG